MQQGVNFVRTCASTDPSRIDDFVVVSIAALEICISAPKPHFACRDTAYHFQVGTCSQYGDKNLLVHDLLDGSYPVDFRNSGFAAKRECDGRVAQTQETFCASCFL